MNSTPHNHNSSNNGTHGGPQSGLQSGTRRLRQLLCQWVFHPTPTLFRVFAVLLALTALGMVGYALYLQHVEYLDPCPLCVLQRYGFILMALCLLLAALLGPRPLGRALTALGGVLSLVGAGIAAFHLWVLAHPNASCGADVIETFVNNLPPAKLLPEVFFAGGICGFPLPPVLGLSIPLWALIWLSILGVKCLWLAKTSGKADDI